MNMTTDEKHWIGSPPVATGTTAVVSNIIDCEGALYSLWVLDLGAVGAGCVITVEESDVADLSTGKQTIGTVVNSVTVPASGSNRLVLIEAIQPLKRYQRLTMTRPGAAVVNSITCRTRIKSRPAIQSTAHVSIAARLIKGA